VTGKYVDIGTLQSIFQCFPPCPINRTLQRFGGFLLKRGPLL